MTKRLTLSMLLAAMFAGLAAGAAGATEPLPYYGPGDPGPEAAGCYFERGQMYCGRYCYWEINGKRYCQRRERDAHPQGDIYIEESIVRRGPRRPHRHHSYNHNTKNNGRRELLK